MVEVKPALDIRGRRTVWDLGKALGMPSDALYFHLRKLVRAGLVVVGGTRTTSRRDAILYALPAKGLKIEHEDKPAARRMAQRLLAAALRSAARDFSAGLESGRGVTNGPRRNLWGGRLKGWLSPADQAHVNKLLGELCDLLRSSRPSKGRQRRCPLWKRCFPGGHDSDAPEPQL